MRRGKDRESFIEITANPLFTKAEIHDLDDYRKDKLLIPPISPHTKKPPNRPILKNELSAIFESSEKEMSEINSKSFLVGLDYKYRSLSAPVSPLYHHMSKTKEKDYKVRHAFV